MAEAAEAGRRDAVCSSRHQDFKPTERKGNVDRSRRGTVPFTWIVVLALALSAAIYICVVFGPDSRPRRGHRSTIPGKRILKLPQRKQESHTLKSCSNSRSCKQGAQCIGGTCVRTPTTAEKTDADATRREAEQTDVHSTRGELDSTADETTNDQREQTDGWTDAEGEPTDGDTTDEEEEEEATEKKRPLTRKPDPITLKKTVRLGRRSKRKKTSPVALPTKYG